MSRTARYIEPNGYYHVISRSAQNQWILKDNEDLAHFRNLEFNMKQDFPINLYHYVFMNTHFHMVVQAPNKEILSAHFSFLKWHYTSWMKHKYGWSGPLWKERYKSLPIENERYLSACGVYIEYNPVRAGICEDPSKYKFSSYRYYHGGPKDKLIDDYDADFRFLTKGPMDLITKAPKSVFSRTRAIGRPSFIKQFAKQ